MAGLVAYATIFGGAFLLDDEDHLLRNPHIRTLNPFEMFRDPLHAGRPFVGWTFAWSHALSGLHTWGFHLVNLAIHLTAAIFLYDLLRRVFLSPRLNARYGRFAPQLAFTGALLWEVHPLLVQAVTYTTQRFESLMGLCCFVGLWAFARALSWGESPISETGVKPAASPVRYRRTAVMLFVLGAASKQDIVVAPVAALLLDRFLDAGSFQEAWRRRRNFYLTLFAATWGTLLLLGLFAPRPQFAGLQNEVATPWRYLLTQLDVVAHYARQGVWPVGLAFDEGWPLTRGLAGVGFGGWITAAALVATIYGLVRGFLWSLAPALYFLALAPSSSVLPIADNAWNYRTYVATAALLAGVVLGLHEISLRRAKAPFLPAFRGVLGVATLAFMITTFRQNLFYRNEAELWFETARVRPNNARAWVNSGVSLERQGNMKGAQQAYLKALEITPQHASALQHLGRHQALAGNHTAALRYYDQAVASDPSHPEAHYHRGLSLIPLGRLDEAEKEFTTAGELDPNLAESYNMLGTLMLKRGRAAEAVPVLQRALAIRPNLTAAQFALGTAYGVQEKSLEAIAAFEATLKLDPKHAGAMNNLGLMAFTRGDREAAKQWFRKALEVDAANPEARRNLAFLENPPPAPRAKLKRTTATATAKPASQTKPAVRAKTAAPARTPKAKRGKRH